MLGRQLGHFEIVALLGEGGMGAVYKARDTHLDRLAAVKVLPHDKMSDPERRKRFSQEAKAASALNHPNIITIYDIASDGEVDFIAMEFVEGQTLEALLAWGALRIADAIKYSRQMADALVAAHAAGIIHRDLKPANVMVRINGHVKLLDFGLAKLTGFGDTEDSGATRTMALTQAGSVMGTVAYMSPEQAEGKKLDYRSDIFSFGLVMYEMVTGKRAFGGNSQASMMASLLRDEPKPIAELRPDVPPQLDYLITRCLRKEPEWRIQTMTELKATLDDLPEALRLGASSSSIRPPVYPAPPPPQQSQAWHTQQPSSPPPTQQWQSMPPQPQWQAAPPSQPWPTPQPQQIPYIPPPVPHKRGFFRRFWWVFFMAFWLIPATCNRIRSFIEDSVRPPRKEVSVALSAAPFTTGSGWARQPAFSRDGKQVAYSWNGSDPKVFNIYVKPVGEKAPRKVTSGSTEDFGPAWSPDGHTIAFLRQRKDVDEIILTPPTGEQKAVKIAEIAHRTGNGLAWSKDGSRLIFPDSPAASMPVALYELTLSSGAKRRLVKPGAGQDLWPSMSPDGSTVAFVRQTGPDESEIYTAEMPDSDESDAEAQAVTSLGEWSAHPVWTAGGDELIFGAGKAGATDLWRVSISSKSPQRLANVGDGGEDAAISPKGRRLVYGRKDGGLWVVDQFR